MDASCLGFVFYIFILLNSKLKIFEIYFNIFWCIEFITFYIGEEIYYKQTVYIPDFIFG